MAAIAFFGPDDLLNAIASGGKMPAIMELGGKSAALVMPDADLDVVMESVR